MIVEWAVKLAEPFGAFAWLMPILSIPVFVQYMRWRSNRTGIWADKWPCRTSATYTNKWSAAQAAQNFEKED